MDIISMAQHARPKLIGQMEFLRPQLISLSSVVVSRTSPRRIFLRLLIDARKQLRRLA